MRRPNPVGDHLRSNLGIISGPGICKMRFYYMAGSASGQDESNPALWLATRAGKMELSCPLGITRCPSAWHRKFNPNNNAGFLRFSCCFGGKRSLKSSVNSRHLPKGKEREWNRPGVVKTLFQLQWMWVESVSCPACSILDRIDFEKLIVSSRVPNYKFSRFAKTVFKS